MPIDNPDLSFHWTDGAVRIGTLNGLPVYIVPDLGTTRTDNLNRVPATTGGGSAALGHPAPASVPTALNQNGGQEIPRANQEAIAMQGQQAITVPPSGAPRTPAGQQFPSGINGTPDANIATVSPGGTMLFDTPPSYQLPPGTRWRLNEPPAQQTPLAQQIAPQSQDDIAFGDFAPEPMPTAAEAYEQFMHEYAQQQPGVSMPPPSVSAPQAFASARAPAGYRVRHQ